MPIESRYTPCHVDRLRACGGACQVKRGGGIGYLQSRATFARVEIAYATTALPAATLSSPFAIALETFRDCTSYSTTPDGFEPTISCVTGKRRQPDSSMGPYQTSAGIEPAYPDLQSGT